MYDQQLVEYLTADTPREIVLIGEPVFRLSSLLNENVKSGEAGNAQPDSGTRGAIDTNRQSQAAAGDAGANVLESASIDDFLKDLQAPNSTVSGRVMCLHLSDTAADAANMLGLACRTSPQLVLVEHVQTSPDTHLLADEQFFAFGFRRLLTNTYNSGMQRKLFGYRLSDYKQAPSWLNARFWAHPERFDLQE